MQPVDEILMPIPTTMHPTQQQGGASRDLPAAPSSSSSRVSLHESAKGKVGTCASSTRAMRTYRQLVTLLLWITCARMLQLFAMDVVVAPFQAEGFVFLVLAGVAGVLAWQRCRAVPGTTRQTASVRTGTGSSWSR